MRLSAAATGMETVHSFCPCSCRIACQKNYPSFAIGIICLLLES